MPRYCSRCKVNKSDIYLHYMRQYLCLDCFNRFFEKRVYESVKKLRMFRGGKYIGTGLSGGKDSASLLYSLTKVFPENEYVAIYLHHGIGDYSRDSYVKAKVLAEKIGVNFQVFNYEKEIGIRIPYVEKTIYKTKVCSVCGTISRWALSSLARKLGADVLATGHNLDDMIEVMLNHFIYHKIHTSLTTSPRNIIIIIQFLDLLYKEVYF